MVEIKSKKTSSNMTLLLAVLISLSSLVSISITTTSIPLVIQNMMCVLAGALLGSIQGAGATGLFLVAGTLGLPIFAGGSSGIEAITGTNGGYILGYFFASLVSGKLIGKPSTETITPIAKVTMGAAVGFFIIYFFGTIQYMNATNITLQEALYYCVIPFLPYDAVKLLVTVLLAIKLRPVIATLTSSV